MRRTAFLINFSFASLLVPASVACLALPVLMPGNPAVAGAFLGGMFALLAFSIWAALEWRAYMRSDPEAERQAAFCSAMFGGLMLFASVFNVLSIVQANKPVPGGLGRSLIVVIPPAVWFVAVGLWRLSNSRPHTGPVDAGDDESLAESP